MTVAAFVIALIAQGLGIYNLLAKPKVKIASEEKEKKSLTSVAEGLGVIRFKEK
jgi:hypothetical protein